MIISERQLIRLIREAIDDTTGEGSKDSEKKKNKGANISKERLEHKINQELMRIGFHERSKSSDDHNTFWKKKIDEVFPIRPKERPKDWKVAYGYLYGEIFVKERKAETIKQYPKWVLTTVSGNAPQKKTLKPKENNKFTQMMTTLYNDFYSGERRGEEASARNELYRDLEMFYDRTDMTKAEKNIAGGAWLTQPNRRNDPNQWHQKFVKMSDVINKCFINVREYVRENLTVTDKNDMRGVVDGIIMRLMDLHKVLVGTNYIEELLNISTILMKGAEGQQKNFYNGVPKNPGIRDVLDRIRRHTYEIETTISELKEFMDTGYTYDIDANGKIIKKVSEAVMRRIKGMLF